MFQALKTTQKFNYDDPAHRTRNDAGTSLFTGGNPALTEPEPTRYAASTSSGFIHFALYEAYGTRPYEWGDDPDRQKANTKEEESDLGLLNEGMRFRDLETGVFLTRDPIGYGDGPNVYCYVHCNPIMSFDAFGLWEDDGDGGLSWDGHLNIYNEDGADDENATANMEVSADQIEGMIKGAEDGYVTLPNGSKISVEAMQGALDANADILSSTASAAKDGRTAANIALADGHMSYDDAKNVKAEVLQHNSVVSLGEHWSARTVLNDVETRDALADPSILQRDYDKYNPFISIYHGPGWGKGCSKYVSPNGPEIVFDAQGKLETRIEYMGTYNYSKAEHVKLDVEPYAKWGNGPGDNTPRVDKVLGPGTSELFHDVYQRSTSPTFGH